MEIVQITCTDTSKIVNADVLRKTDKLLEVVVAESKTKLRLFKHTPHEKFYVGKMAGLEFTSTGENII